MNAIEVSYLSKSYKVRHKSVKALDGLSFVLEKGHIGGFVGPNGAGKTTTIKILLGLLFKDSGTVKLFGTGDYDTVSVRKKIGFVPEEFSLYEYMSGEELLSFNASIYRAFDTGTIADLQRLFSLPLNRKISSYSKGMKKLLSLYLAVSVNPELLILDEPTDGLDPIFRERFLSFLVDFVSEHGTTVLFSSHILSEVEKVADYAILINKGKLILQGDIDSLKENSISVTFTCKNKSAKIPGAKLLSKEKMLYALSVVSNAEEMLKRLRSFECTILEKRALSFEEIFMNAINKNLEGENESTH